MKSGLEDRNNLFPQGAAFVGLCEVSMKSGLEDRNNWPRSCQPKNSTICGLNEVRPGRPEQFYPINYGRRFRQVSMKSGLEDRNNEMGTLFVER